jgi:two-component system chemotaxis response regulator CheY
LRLQLFTAVLCDENAAGVGARAFGYAARRTSGLLNPLIPIFLVCAGPRRRDVEAARDLGFTDVLTRPVSAATVIRKLKLALGKPRPFIASTDFFGPDRRAPQRSGFRGPDRRTRKARQVKVGAPGDQVLV